MRRFWNNKPNYIISTLSQDISKILLKYPKCYITILILPPKLPSILPKEFLEIVAFWAHLKPTRNGGVDYCCKCNIRKSHLDLKRFKELQYFQRFHGALGAFGCLSKMDIFLGVFGYLSEMAQRYIFTWVSLNIFERSLKHLSKIFQRYIVSWISPGGFQISFYLNVCRYSLTLDNFIEIQIVYSSGIWQFKYRFLSMIQEV